MVNRRVSALVVAASLAVATYLVAAPPEAQAGHTWGNYHWARQSNPFTIQLGNNLTSEQWRWALTVASSDTSASSWAGWDDAGVLNTKIEAGGDKSCRRGTVGRVEVCNAKYGQNGWLGIAQVWSSGDHITQGTVKLNDTYFAMPQYNNSWWRHFVMCQEIGHTFGLGHQDETFNNKNLGSCMDYTNDPTGTSQLTPTETYGPDNQRPNQHDYDLLGVMYEHLDDRTTVGTSAATSPSRGAVASDEAGDGPPEWGRPVRHDHEARPILYRKDLGGDRQLHTWVRWARPDDRPGRQPEDPPGRRP